MKLDTLLIQILLTIPLTIIINYIDNKYKNKTNYIIIPTIYMILISAFIPSIKDNIFLIVIFEIFIRNFYVTNFLNNNKKESPKEFLITSILSIILSLFTYNYFLSKVDIIIPTPESIKPFLWFLIIIYLIYLYKQITKEKIDTKTKNNIERQKENTIVQYAKLKSKYSNLIKSKNGTINVLTYALMIHEDTKKPKLYRKISEYIGAITKKETKYGILQVPSYNHLTDEETIKITINNFETIKKENDIKDKELIDYILKDYNQIDKDDIITIYNDIVEFNKK